MTSCLSIEETKKTFVDLEALLHCKRDVEILLGYLRPSLEGVFPICSHLAHHSMEVRRLAFRILSEIRNCGSIGEGLIMSMNPFTIQLYLQAEKEMKKENYLGGLSE